MQKGEDCVPADEGVFMVGELCDQEIVERALLLGRDGGVTRAFAGVVAGAAPSGAPGLARLTRWEAAGEETPVDGGLWVSRTWAIWATYSPAS
jgi:hypothetical protein